LRKIAAIPGIPIAFLAEAATGANTVVVIVTRTRTHITTLRKTAAVAVIPVAILVEAAGVAMTVAVRRGRT
jgi:hypothetical protein